MVAVPERRMWMVALLAALSLWAATYGQEKADEPAKTAAPQFTEQVNNAKRLAKNMSDEYEQMSGDVQSYQAVAQDDLAKAKEVYDLIGAKLQGAIAAWEQNDDAKARPLYQEAEKALGVREVWRQRLLDARRAQGDSLPSEQWYQEISTNMKPGAKEALTHLVEVKKAAADAWGAVADAMVPGADAAELKKLREKALAARAEVEIATWQYLWKNRLEEVWADKRVTKDDIAKPLADLEAAQEAQIKLQRERIELDRRTRQAGEKHGQAQEALFRAYWTATQAKEREAAEKAAEKPVEKAAD